MGSTTGRLGSLLPVVVEGNQLSRLFVGQQLFPDPEEVFAELSQPFNEALHFILRPALLYQFGYRLFHQTLQSLAGVVAALVKSVKCV